MLRIVLSAFALMLVLAFAISPAAAQTQAPRSPFASPGAPAPQAMVPQADSEWMQPITDIQRELQKRLADAIRALKSGEPLISGGALILVSFLYGVFHAVGPGHGKAVISTYVLANNVTLRRGIGLSFAAAFVQALTALAIMIAVAGVFQILGVKPGRPLAQLQNETVAWLVTISSAFIALAGMAFFVSAVRRMWAARSAPEAHHHHGHTHSHDGATCSCGHSHMPDPATLVDGFSWRRAAFIALMVGIRPCTGALIVLVVASAQGMYWAGVLSTFVMAIGTAITVSTIAALVVGARWVTLYFSGAGWTTAVYNVAAIGGALLLTMLGVTFFLASLGPVHPF